MSNKSKYSLPIWALGLLLLFIGHTHLHGQDSLPQPRIGAHEAFAKEDYQQAVQIYQAELDANGTDATMLYNLAVCYRKMGMIPEAILMLERAMLLEPTRTDIRSALSDAYVSTKDVQAQVLMPPTSLFDGLAYALSLPVWAVFGLLCLGGSIFGFFAFRLMPTLVWRKRAFYASLGVFVLSLISNAMIAHQLYYHHQREARFILLKPVALMNRPEAEAKPIGKLNEGSAVHLLTAQEGWYEVKTAYGHAGWIPADAAEPVVHTP